MATEIAEDILEHSSQIQSFRFTPFLVSTHSHRLAATAKHTAACRAFLQGHCPLGSSCPEPHTTDPSTASEQQQSHHRGAHQGGGGGHGSFNSLVCKHWLRGLCKKGEACEFLHEYNLRKMPECNFFVRNGYCSNGDECLYLHIDPLSKLPPCPHYERGFCPLGPTCAKKHVRRRLCPYYLAGFCPDGRSACKEGAHPKWRSDAELGEPVAKGDLAATAAAATAAMAGRDGDEYAGQDGRYFDQNEQGDRDGDGGHQRDRGYGRDQGRDRQRDGDHGGQRKWRGGRGGGAGGVRGSKSNRRYRDRH